MNDRSAKQIDVDPSGRMVFQMRFWRSFRPLVGEQGLASVDSTSFISLIHYSSLSAIKFSRANMKRIALKTISWWSTWPDWPLTQQHAASSNHNRFITSRINLEQRINNRSCPLVIDAAGWLSRSSTSSPLYREQHSSRNSWPLTPELRCVRVRRLLLTLRYDQTQRCWRSLVPITRG